MIAVAAVFGLLAVFATRTWLQGQADARMRSMDTNRAAPVAATRTVVVATRPLRFGNELSPQALREVPWHEEALPPGAFNRVADVLSAGKRVVLTAIEANEPVLGMKITGPGQRATLSALVGPGMKAVTIRVNDVDGVGGFVLPGDRVDVVLTHQNDKDAASTHVLLQDVRVLAVDQVADERAVAPTIPKVVTLEVDTVSGQKLSLAASIGTLSLLLRKAGETTETKSLRVTIKDLMNELVAEKHADQTARVVVTRGSSSGIQKQDYQVPQEAAGPLGYATAESR